MDSLAALVLLALHVGVGDGERYSAKYNAADLRAPADRDTAGALVAEALTSLDERHEHARWPRRVVRCARTIGFVRCLKAFAVWRGDRAAEAFSRGESLQFHLRNELEEQFPWETFSNRSEGQLNARLTEHAERLFHGRDVSLSYPGGVRLDVHSQLNGSLRIDFKKETADVSARGRGNRWRRTFYRIVPYMLIPPLIMAAILPFKLPAFMMLSMGAVMINNMAFTGSLFTLLRNNAFNDNYEKKVIYVNDGYKNEEALPAPQHESAFPEGAFPVGVYPEGVFPEESFNNGGYSNGGFSSGAFSVTSFPEVFSSDGFYAESTQGELYESSGKVKKRRGHKHKRKRPGKRRPEGLGQEWDGQAAGSFPVSKLSGSAALHQKDSFHGLPEVDGGGAEPSEGEDFVDYSDFKESFKSKSPHN